MAGPGVAAVREPGSGLHTKRRQVKDVVQPGPAGDSQRRLDHDGVLRAEHPVVRDPHRRRHGGDPNTAFSFHDYCAANTELEIDVTCSQQDEAVFNNARRYTNARGIPALLTEFGATNDLANLTGVLQRADADRVGWLEWAYTGNDKTSSSPTEQALVFNPACRRSAAMSTSPSCGAGRALPAGGGGHADVVVVQVGHLPAVLLARRADGQGSFSPGAQTLISVPPVEYPSGYHATVTGGQVVSMPNAPVLTVVAAAGASSVDVVVTP